MKYEVTDIQVISPDDVDAIKIQDGRDLVTLLTCYPPNTGGRQRPSSSARGQKNENQRFSNQRLENLWFSFHS